MRSVQELSKLSGIRVLVRADLNAPLEGGKVADPLRIDSALRTIEYLLAHGARVVIASHMSDKTGSLAPVFEYLKRKINVTFVSDVAGLVAHRAANELKNGTALLLENIRRNAGEEANDGQFVRELASLADIYVNEAFPVSHRSHASVVGVPGILPGYAGFQFLDEVAGLTPALFPESPSLAVIGGAKLVTKQKLIHTLLKKYDKLFIGGAIVNDVFKAQGFEVGKSMVSDSTHVMELLGNSKLIIPTDVTVANPNGVEDKDIGDVHGNDFIYDIGPKSIIALGPAIARARTVLWNGPMGNFEKGYRRATDDLARMIANAPGRSIVGGGDTLSSIQNLGLMEKFEFVSTAGGAMLDFLANGTLPGIEALEKSSRVGG